MTIAALDELRWRPRTIRFRLTLWYLGILLAVLVIFASVVYIVFSRGLRAEMYRSLEAVAQGALDLADNDHLELDPFGVPPEYAVSVYALDGTLLASHNHGLPWDPEPASPPPNDRWRSVHVRGETWRVLVSPIIVGQRQIGTLLVGRPEGEVEHVINQLGVLLATLIPLSVLLAGIGGLFLAGRALNPIDRIARSAASIGADDLSRRLPHQSASIPDEVGRLAAAFNSMLDRLEGAFQRQHQFTADASHELRTPLMLLLTQVDIALQRPRAVDEHRHILVSLREDLLRLRRLLDALLSLARADAREVVLAREPVELGELAEQVVEVMRPMADERGIRLTARNSSGHVVVHGDEAQLMELLVNLVENALKHTSVGGSIDVAAGVEADQVTAFMAVRDTGVGIPREHLPHVFERFYRVDPARSSSGSGLGLSISRWIAEAHDGRLDVDSQLGVGTTFTVRLPVSRSLSGTRAGAAV